MKVVILNNDFRVYWKGRLQYLKRFLSQNNVVLNAIELFGAGSPYEFDNFTTSDNWWTCLFPKQGADDLTAKAINKRLVAALDQLQPDVIIGPSIVFYAGALGLRWAKKNGKRFIMFDDGKTSQIKRNAAVQWIKDQLIAQTDALWLPSAHYDVEYPLISPGKTLFFYGFNSIDNQLFQPREVNPLNHHLIICVARLVPIKNLDRLLQAWQIVEQHNKTYQLLLIGDGPERATLEALATRLGLVNVIFKGVVDNDKTITYYHKADAMILPSLSESWGLVVNEAMAAGLPVLLSNRVNAAETLLEPGVNGFLFDPFQVDEIAGAIQQFIALDAIEKAGMAAVSLRIIAGISYEIMGQRLLEALNQLAKRAQVKPGFIALALMQLWSGKYDTSTWNQLQKSN